MILFLAQNDFFTKENNGGLAITRRNYQILCNIFGKENVEVAVIAPDNSSFGFQSNPKLIWLEGNLRGLKTTINELFNHTYITGKGEKTLFRLLSLRHYDMIWSDSTHYGSLAKKIHKKFDVKIISYAYDFESEYMLMYCKPSIRKPHFYLKMKRVRQNERDAVLYSDRFICISERDRSLYQQHYQHDVDLVFPVTLLDQYNGASKQTTEQYLLFVGSYFAPNIEGVEWFAKNVAPSINIKTKIVGNGMEKLKDNMFPDIIEIIGRADNLSLYYTEASAVILPIFSGSGMKVKTAEAMMYGKPLIGTDEALQGYNVDGLKGVYRANTSAEFIDAVKSVSKEGGYFQEVRNSFLRNCETSALEMKVKKLIDEL